MTRQVPKVHLYPLPWRCAASCGQSIRQAQLSVQTSDKPIERTHVVMPGLEEGRRRGPGGTVNRWRQRPLRLSPDGDVPTHAPVQPPIIVLRDRDRYRLMTRYRLTPDQVDRLPVDIAWILLRLPRSARKRTPTRTAIRSSSFQPGDPVTGGWCVVCGLPSLIRVPLYVLSPRGVSLWRIIEACAEDGMHKHLPGKPELLRFDA